MNGFLHFSPAASCIGGREGESTGACVGFQTATFTHLHYPFRLRGLSGARATSTLCSTLDSTGDSEELTCGELAHVFILLLHGAPQTGLAALA
ncbi:hypothetical protein MHYP_G00341200 [Metynnis hypsauchen]